VVPDNITLLELPPYSPELNPVERIWHYLRSHWLANSIFSDLKHIMDACEIAWQRFAADHGLIRSLCAVAWAPVSPALCGDEFLADLDHDRGAGWVRLWLGRPAKALPWGPLASHPDAVLLRPADASSLRR
jgi:hypothetical protein